MKFFAVFAAVVAVACAAPSTWTMTQLSEAIQNPTTSSALKPVLEQALDIYMEAIYSGNYQESITISTAAGVTGTFTLAQLDRALSDPTISSSIFKPYLEKGLNEIMTALFAGEQKESVDVFVPAFQLSYLSLQEIDSALATASNPALVPYLEKALDDLMFHLVNGGKQHSILVAVPADIVAESTAVASPVAVVDSHEVVAPSPIAVSPVAPEAPAAPLSTSPLVQIIVNIESNTAEDVFAPSHIIERPQPGQAVVVERPTPEQTIVPTPVVDRPTPVQTLPISNYPVVDRPTPVQSIPIPNYPVVDRPTPVQTIPIPSTPVVDRPTPVQTIPIPAAINPIDVIAVLPIEA